MVCLYAFEALLFFLFNICFVVIAVPESVPTTEIAETIPVSSTTDWQTAFGFGPTKKETQDDDLGMQFISSTQTVLLLHLGWD